MNKNRKRVQEQSKQISTEQRIRKNQVGKEITLNLIQKYRNTFSISAWIWRKVNFDVTVYYHFKHYGKMLLKFIGWINLYEFWKNAVFYALDASIALAKIEYLEWHQNNSSMYIEIPPETVHLSFYNVSVGWIARFTRIRELFSTLMILINNHGGASIQHHLL